MTVRVFGHIPGIRPGDWFPDRAALARARVHPPRQAGISYGRDEGADSIVLSGGYEDDVDLGDEIYYTGQGGNDRGSRRQTESQSLSKGNYALAVSCREGYPVRVSRRVGSSLTSGGEPGYVYSGLYRVDSYWQDVGLSGFRVWRFRLTRLEADHLTYVAEDNALYLVADGTTERRETIVQRIIRNSRHADAVKRFYGHRCQICRDEVRTAAGLYVEAAHIMPLGSPHNGPDSLTNLLCLCPNHHASLDLGGFFFTDRWEVIDAGSHIPVGELSRNHRHPLDPAFAAYHRRLFTDQS